MKERKRKSRQPDDNPWPERLRAIRERLGLTQEQAAEKAGTVLRTWQNWEYGRTKPSKSTIRLIEIVFGS